MCLQIRTLYTYIFFSFIVLEKQQQPLSHLKPQDPNSSSFIELFQDQCIGYQNASTPVNPHVSKSNEVISPRLSAKGSRQLFTQYRNFGDHSSPNKSFTRIREETSHKDRYKLGMDSYSKFMSIDSPHTPDSSSHFSTDRNLGEYFSPQKRYRSNYHKQSLKLCENSEIDSHSESSSGNSAVGLDIEKRLNKLDSSTNTAKKRFLLRCSLKDK